jgi:hypothetical protein
MKYLLSIIVSILAFQSCNAQPQINKQIMMSTEIRTKTVLLFGGNPERRREIIDLLQPLQNTIVIGTLSEEEGMEQLHTLPKVDVVLIGGRYIDEQRIRIRNFIFKNYPELKITEPGVDYPYSNEAIFTHIQDLIIK